jgi:hypothetical protein
LEICSEVEGSSFSWVFLESLWISSFLGKKEDVKNRTTVI